MSEKKRRKKGACLNCGYLLLKNENFCPECGQENNDQNVSLGTLLGEFLSHFFAIDSKLSRSLYPFFLKPGFLTNRFNEGRRTEYVHPMRLYLVLSLFYFLVLGIYWNGYLVDTPDWDIFNPDRKEVSANPKKSTTKENNLDSIATVTPKPVQPKRKVLTKDGVLDIKADSLKEVKVKKEMKWNNLDLYSEVKNLNDDGLSIEKIYDSLNIQQPFGKYVIKQYLKLNKKPEALAKDAIKNLPAMMFVLLPIFALILGLLYIRHEHLYIHHLIHSIHLHCFAYLIYGVEILLYMIIPEDYWFDSIFLWSFVIVTTYAFISVRRVYKQGRRKSMLKFLMLGNFYLIVLIIGALIEIFVSALLF